MLSFVVPAASGGGWLWLLPAITVPWVASFLVLGRQLGPEDAGFRPDDRERRVRMVLGTAVAVAALSALVAVAYQG